jgi:hypothetical protein
MTDRDFTIAIGAMDDCRRSVAAGKLQRWEVLKWGTSLNTAIIAATALPNVSFWIFFYLSIMVSIISIVLVFYYNSKMTRVRGTMLALVQWLEDNKIDYEKITKIKWRTAYKEGEDYDAAELYAFSGILAMPPLVALLWFVCGK